MRWGRWEGEKEGKESVGRWGGKQEEGEWSRRGGEGGGYVLV